MPQHVIGNAALPECLRNRRRLMPCLLPVGLQFALFSLGQAFATAATNGGAIFIL